MIKKPGHRTSKGRGQFKRNDRRVTFWFKDNIVEMAMDMGLRVKSQIADQKSKKLDK